MKVVAAKRTGLAGKPVAADWLGVVGLLLLSAVPIIAGAARITQLVGGAEVTSENARFFASPIPVVIHIVGATLYSLLGAFQFSPAMRRKQIGRHRLIGYLLTPAGLAVALSGLWMAQFYEWPEGDGVLLYWMRIVFGMGMVLSLCLGYLATRRHEYVQHGMWMARAYAIGLGAGTQVLTHVPYFLIFGVPNEFARAMLMLAGWVINLVVAEWFIYQRMAQIKSRAV